MLGLHNRREHAGTVVLSTLSPAIPQKVLSEERTFVALVNFPFCSSERCHPIPALNQGSTTTKVVLQLITSECNNA